MTFSPEAASEPVVEIQRGPKYIFRDAVITDIRNESPSVKLFEIEVLGMDSFPYQAGQFVQLDLPIQSKITRRSYSISSPPDGSNRFQLCVVHVPDGPGSSYLFNCEVGTILKCSDALGRFVLPDVVDHEISFICTGVGIAPFRSMLLDGYAKNKITKPVTLFFGNRHAHDILYRSEWEQMASEHAGFKFFPILSRENSWNGLKGHVHAHYQNEYQDKRDCTFYICGWREMINETRKNLAELGYTTKQIKFELYT